ncbi:MAG: HD domain-containing phosphohydrolase [Clostridiales bacterium]
MEKSIIDITILETGMKLAENILDSKGNIIIYENTVLTSYIIDLFKSNKIDNVCIYSEKKLNIDRKEIFEDFYKNGIRFLKNIFNIVITEKIIDTKKVDKLTLNVFDFIDCKELIINKINKEISIENYIYFHTLNVSLLSMLIAKWLNKNDTCIKDIIKASLLHDLGMIRVPKYIQNKENRLFDNEFKEIMKHPVYGFRLIKENTNYSNDIMSAVLMHHEKEDGTGYPVGLKSEKIHIYAKIIIISDVYNAMVSKRSYRTKHSPFKVLNLFKNESIGVYDHKTIGVFLNNISSYYIGSKIMLSDGQIGEVVHINEMTVSKPIIKINDEIFDLSKYKDIEIIQIIT